MKKRQSEINGHLDVFIEEKEEDDEGELIKWQNILIHGDSDGLKSLARLLIKIADINQDNINDLPIGAREHIHLKPNFDTSKSSIEIIIGRLDAKGTGNFYERYIPKNN